MVSIKISISNREVGFEREYQLPEPDIDVALAFLRSRSWPIMEWLRVVLVEGLTRMRDNPITNRCELCGGSGRDVLFRGNPCVGCRGSGEGSAFL